MKTSLHLAATPQHRARPRVNNRPHPKMPSSGQHPRPPISCPDSGRCRGAGFLAHRLGAILSDAADHYHGAFSA
jgi:hypothetical protein